MRHYVIARYEVKDFDRFQAEFAQVAPQLPEHGFPRTWLNRNADNPEEIVVLHECEDLGRAHAFFESDEYRECTRRAGITAEPRLAFLEELAGAPAAA
jgi:uncharacterized protein (DUF1330 family)